MPTSAAENIVRFAPAEVWAHRRVGTDMQSLLAFCCEASCARSIRAQVYFNPVSGCNEEVRREWAPVLFAHLSFCSVLFCSVENASGIRYIVETHQSHNVLQVCARAPRRGDPP